MGEFAIKKILRSRLPQRLAHRAPPLLVELLVGLASAVVLVLLRMPLVTLVADRAPYALNFLAVVMATVLAGWRSGLVALVAGQFLTWYAIVPPYLGMNSDDRHLVGGLVIATVSQILILIVIAFYQREIDKAVAASQQRMNLLDEALSEIDHRTRNNYQTVLAMIDLQSRRAEDANVKRALGQVGDRIQAISNASQQLAVRSEGLDAVRLDDHLCGLVQQIERGLARDGIDVECSVPEVTASADKATSISIIVNELVTNAIKHAFNGEGSGHVWVTGKADRTFKLIVADDGRGIEATRRDGHAGLGSRLVDSFARQLGAKHEVTSTHNGTTHTLVIPRLS